MSTPLCALLAARGLPYEENVPMASRTSLRVGGPAACWVSARSTADIAATIAVADEAGVARYIVGNGSNLLVRDGGIDGLVIHIGDGMRDIRIGDDGTLWAQAGAMLSQTAVQAQAAGLSGMEAISGIPGTVGGAVCMNAGSYGVEISSLVREVEAIDDHGNILRLSADALSFGYRTSTFLTRGWTVTAATLALTADDPQAIQARMRGYAAQRREKQPLQLPSAGSFFKRPQGHFAGALIEQAGLKGLSVGGAQVSPMHAGFLVNTGNATARDFLTLMETVQARVLADSGIMLEAEVRILGCDSSC